ncbi:MAG: type II toxin-antitoxin system RelE/ParE family toxin [Proteobacteria bacterium]|nr:type II toxin-antitoxin system RelE/ParE family toxin [Pseudomonadota bacterium]
MLKINFSKSAQKILKSLSPKHKHQCALKIQELILKPLPNDVKSIKGTSFLRVSVGEYRIVYQYTKENLEVLLLDKRNNDL